MRELKKMLCLFEEKFLRFREKNIDLDYFINSIETEKLQRFMYTCPDDSISNKSMSVTLATCNKL